MTAPTPINRESLVAALNATGGSVTEAARVLKIHRVTVYKLMRRHGVEVRRVAKEQEAA